MAWSAITSVVTYSAGNAIPVTNTGAEPISVTVKRPASGADVIVTFYADGAPVHTMTTSASDPIKTSAFSAPGATSLNYSTDRAFASPGASISASTEASAPSSTPSGDVAVAGAIIAQNSISSFLPGQTAGVPDAASLTVVAGVSQRVALPTGTAFRLDWSGYGPFAFRFGSSSVAAVATDFPGVVGLPQYFHAPGGATHIAVYGDGGGTLKVTGGTAGTTPSAGAAASRTLRHSAAMKITNNASPLAPIVVAADSTVFAKLQVRADQSTCTVMIENYGAAEMVYDNVSIRVGGNGNQGTTVRLQKSGSNTITVPAALVPITNSSDSKYGVPGVVLLDFPVNIDMDNLASGLATASPFFVYVRAHTTTGGTIQGTPASGDTLYPNAGGVVAGDAITTWPVVTQLTTNYPASIHLYVRYKKPIVSIMGIGDSHVASEGWFAAAIAAANATVTDRLAVYFKQAVGGVGSLTIRQWAELYIPLVKPDFVYIPWGTFNDGSTTTIPTSRQNLLAVVALCESLGIGVITSTPHPLDGNAGGSFITRTNAVADEVLASYPDRIDFYALTGDRVTAAFLAGMSSDGTHLNATGVATVQPAATATFTAVVQR